MGYYQYHAVPGKTRELPMFSRRVCWLWRTVLVRRQCAQVGWDRLLSSAVGFRDPAFCILVLWLASPLRILGKSRIWERARTNLCGGRSAMAVPTATAIGHHAE